MKKRFVLLATSFLTVASLGGYLFLTKEIIAGELKIAAGQKQLEEGEMMLAKGKARLASGQRQLSGANSIYSKVKDTPYALAAVLPITGAVIAVASDKMAGQKINAGNQEVAEGQKKIMMGEKQLAEGKLALSNGIARLKQANDIRIACGIATIFFALLTIGLGMYFFVKRSKSCYTAKK